MPSSEPSITISSWPARANVPACGAARHPPHAAPNGIRFAPQMISACSAIMPHISIFGEMPMTAYLISLALIGLVVIAVSEEFS